MILNLGCVVEGHGDVEAVPLLFRRIQQQIRDDVYLNMARPVRSARNKLVKPGELERAVRLAARKLRPPRAVVVLIDADDDCPAELAPKLLKRAEGIGLRIPIGIVLAKFEYEAWFLAAIASLGGHRGLVQEPNVVPSPEAIRDAKKHLTRLMEGPRSYSETVDQPALTALFDMQLARQRSDSFDKCWREIQRLLETTVENT